MSRIGKLPIPLPGNVEVNISGAELRVKGPKGELSLTVPEVLEVKITEGVIRVFPREKGEAHASQWGLYRSLINNLVVGVTEGFEKQLEVVGVGYRVQQEGPKKLSLRLGFSHPVVVRAPEGIEFEVLEGNKIKVSGIDKALVGQVAAYIRSRKPPEPYKGKGIRYLGEVVKRKAGKSAKVGGTS